jgi:hypothetical protein
MVPLAAAAAPSRGDEICGGGRRPARITAVKAALLVESLTGNTWTAAEQVADLLAQERWTITGLSKVKQPDHASIQQADLILVGTWVHGAFLFGQAPWALSNISNLPTMRGKRAAGFCTFALDPGTSLDKLDRALGDTGAYVIGGLAMSRSKLRQHTEIFAERLVDAMAVG